MKRTILLLLCCIGFTATLSAQQVDIERLGDIAKQKPLTIGGGLSAGSISYFGNEQYGRQPWTWYLNGSINFTLFGQLSLPFGINLTNLGRNLSYPSLPNRFSLHPKYKWATAHIGDISMSFSPYTLSGHQFTGAGLELTPGKWKIAAMGGRLLKPVEYDMNTPSVMPNYGRFGMGAKVQFDDKRFSIGATYFTAEDRENNSMQQPMDSLGITPMSNHAMGINTTLNVIKNLSLQVEYALSLLTKDTRAPKENATYDYHAVNARLSYQLWKNTIGLNYERIDPDYKTLGAYYFNNDYENLTLSYARPFLKDDKANIALNFGVQRDDLNDTKEESAERYVGSVNLNYTPSESFQLSLNYSTFQSYRNLKSQFDYINETSPYDNMDTLRFTQLSQNMDMSMTYTFKKSEKQQQRLNLNASYQESADRQGGISPPGTVSRFLNSALGYGLQLIPQSISFNTSVNVSYAYAARSESYTLGPMAGVTAAFFKKKLSTGLSAAYNVNLLAGDVSARVLNIRANASYRFLKRNSLNANIVWQNRNLKGKKTTDTTTITVAYAYSF